MESAEQIGKEADNDYDKTTVKLFDVYLYMVTIYRLIVCCVPLKYQTSSDFRMLDCRSLFT